MRHLRTVDPTPAALTLLETGICCTIAQLTRLQCDGAPDGEDYVPDQDTIVRWLAANARLTLNAEQVADVMRLIDGMVDADILEVDIVHGVRQYHLTDMGTMLLDARLRRKRPASEVTRASDGDRDL